MAVASVYPVSLGLLKTPGSMGFDIVTGEGQSLGLPLSFGGPYLGLFATLKKSVRAMPGRLVGETEDTLGRRAYVLTLSTREQHIRREKATSNICTNQALCALACTIYLSLMGKQGLRDLAQTNLDLAEYAKARLAERGVRLKHSAPTFNEFVVDLPVDADAAIKAAIERRLIPGLSMKGRMDAGDKSLLVNVTEMNSKQQIERLCDFLAGL